MKQNSMDLCNRTALRGGASALAALLTLGVLAGCGKPAENPKVTETTADTTAPAEETTVKELSEIERRALLSDGLPEKKFGGQAFRIFTTAQVYTVDDYTGEAVNDAKYERNRAIEDRFDIVIEENIQPHDKVKNPAYVDQIVRAGDVDAFDVVALNMVVNGAPAVAGNYLNWYDVPHVDFEQPWWPSSNRECLTVNGRAYVAISDAAINTVGGTYCMFFDKDMAVTHSLPDMYELVESGEWTYDKMTELVASIYNDSNGNGSVDAGDYFGLASGRLSNVVTYQWAFDNPVFVREKDGTLTFAYYTEKLPEIVEKVIALFTNYKGVYSDMSSQSIGVQMFAQERALFANGYLSQTISMLGDFEHEYGIIPYPKLNTEQKSYYTMVDGGAHSIGISAVCRDPELVGIVMEALSAETYKRVLPVYLDQTLKLRYSSSPADAAMVDLLLESRVLDFGYVFDNWKGCSFYLQDLLKNNSTDIASYYGARKNAVTAYYDKVLSVFMNN